MFVVGLCNPWFPLVYWGIEIKTKKRKKKEKVKHITTNGEFLYIQGLNGS